MAIIQQNISSPQPTAGYSCNNELIGKIKAVLVQDPNVTIVSDTYPSGNRSLVYKVANQTRTFTITSFVTTTLWFQISNLSGGILREDSSLTTSSNTVFTVTLLYNASCHMLMIDIITTSNTPPRILSYAMNANWYSIVGTWGNSGVYNTIYNQTSDTAISVDSPAYSYLPSSGQFIGIPKRYYQNGVMLNDYYPYIWKLPSVGVPYGILTDASGSKYYSYVNGACSILVKDA